MMEAEGALEDGMAEAAARYRDEGATVMFVAIDGKHAGLVAVADMDDPGRDATQPQRGQQGVTAFGLGDQEAHGRSAVHVLDDLGDQHGHARGAGASPARP